ncbi:MAG: hypothetical protein ACXWM8_01565 [Candidatus Limnocylindrales bacterium]
MNGYEDRDLEQRFRRISTSLDTRVPDSLYDYAGEVTGPGRGKMSPSFGRSRVTGRSRLLATLGVAAAVVVALALAGFAVSIRPAGPAASGSPGASASVAACGGAGDSVLAGASSGCSMPPAPSVSATPGSSVSASASPTSGPVRSPGPTMIASGFTTAGAASGWNSFSWTSAGTLLSGIGQVLQWSGGYVAAASLMHYVADPSPGLWISADGQTWTAARGINDDAVRISVAPAGLVAIGFDGSVADGWKLGSAWSSSDGRSWTKLGQPDFPGNLVSIAGTSSGIVATVEIMQGTGKGQSGNFQIEFSTDGLHWTAESVSPGLSSAQVGYGEPPHVQTHAGRFYLMGSAGPGTTSSGIRLVSSVTPPDEMWLSGDGKTWTKSAGGYSASGGLDADYIDFGRDGMILHTDAYGAAPGATGLAYSSDGGQTWHENTNYDPLGPITCLGECVNGEDGVIGANGTYFVAVKNGGKQAWLSYDGQHWSSIAWTGGNPTGAWNGNGFLVMPRGVLVADSYGAAS